MGPHPHTLRPYDDTWQVLKLFMAMPSMDPEKERPWDHSFGAMNDFSLIPPLQAAAAVGDYRVALRVLNEIEAAVARDSAELDGVPLLPPHTHLLGAHSLGIFDRSSAGSSVHMTRNNRRFAHEQALMACGYGYAPMHLSLALLETMRARGLGLSSLAQDWAILLCKRGYSWQNALGILKAGRGDGIEPVKLRVIYILQLFQFLGEKNGIAPPW